MKLLAKILLFLAVIGALAVPLESISAEPTSDSWIVLTVGSRHRERGYNEKNWGLGLEYGVGEDLRLVAGAYRNSFYRDTVYAGATYTPLRVGPALRLGGAVLVASGYDRQPVLVPFPMLAYEQKNWGLNLGPILPSVVGLQVKFRY